MVEKPDRSCLLTVNGGSSSLKFALFEKGAEANAFARLASGRVERIGLEGARLVVSAANENGPNTSGVNAPDLSAAADLVGDWVDAEVGRRALAGIGNRVVHGGPRYWTPEIIGDEVIAELRRIIPLDVDHLPGEIAVIEAFRRRLPEVAQVACFDTGFHRDLPRVARVVPIPRRFEAEGVRRFGFHGLSYEYLMGELARQVGADLAAGRVILAHLGSGASMAAVRWGRCLETTMGFTPAAGLVMGTRSGDLDPGLPLYLARNHGMTAEAFHTMVNRESGLLGISETSPDVRDLLAHEANDPRAAEALEVFVYQARKWIGSLTAALGGLDILVFSGGIGENSPEIRGRICRGLEFLGILLDPDRNLAAAPLISAEPAHSQVRVIPTDEESIIARHTARVLGERILGG
jgi:acetate kinase